MIKDGKSPEELAKERLARIEAAINLQEPDKVPLWGVGRYSSCLCGDNSV